MGWTTCSIATLSPLNNIVEKISVLCWGRTCYGERGWVTTYVRHKPFLRSQTCIWHSLCLASSLICICTTKIGLLFLLFFGALSNTSYLFIRSTKREWAERNVRLSQNGFRTQARGCLQTTLTTEPMITMLGDYSKRLRHRHPEWSLASGAERNVLGVDRWVGALDPTAPAVGGG